MSWEPISEAELLEQINAAWRRMRASQRHFWEAIRIAPETWAQHPFGDFGGGFWAVGLVGRTVLWYNDIEDGFNRSHYPRYGEIGAYWCNQDQLEWTVQYLLDAVSTGIDSGGFCGPPQPLDAPTI